MNKSKNPRVAVLDKRSIDKQIGAVLRDKAAIKKQIAARVAPAPRKPTVVKKVYAKDSPGAARMALGVTLTALKNAINEPKAVVTVMLDASGQPTGEQTTVAVRDTAACTKRRRGYETRGLIGPSSKSAKQRRRNNRVAACNTTTSKRAA